MIVLLDTCEFLWLISGDSRLPARVATAVTSPANEVYLSVVSFWEICIKHALAKLSLPQAPDVYVPQQRQRHGIDVLNLDELAVARLPHLPTHHKDPFDRMLICQAQAYGMSLASSDPLIRQYPVALL
jgi:PIN domain nuclease of toxin-antitoxin system